MAGHPKVEFLCSSVIKSSCMIMIMIKYGKRHGLYSQSMQQSYKNKFLNQLNICGNNDLKVLIEEPFTT